jgi:hypothetical protein
LDVACYRVKDRNESIVDENMLEENQKSSIPKWQLKA